MSTLYWSLREATETTPALYWSLREAASWLKNLWHWPESGTVPPPDVHFFRVGSGNKENIEESGVILVTSHVVLIWTWCITTRVRSAECVGFCQCLCLVVRVDLMLISAGNETDRAHKIWWERLLAWNIFPQGMLEFNRWNKRILIITIGILNGIWKIDFLCQSIIRREKGVFVVKRWCSLRIVSTDTSH